MKCPVIFLNGALNHALSTARLWCRIIGLLALVGVLGLLQACSAVKLAYNQAPELAYWYLDGYVDFSSAQSAQVKDELTKLHAWHRQTQLPGYISTLQKLQQQMPHDISAQQACTTLSEVRQKALAISVQAEPSVLAIVSTLTPVQLTRLERKFEKTNAEYREDYLDGPDNAPGSAGTKRSKRYKQVLSRTEMLYGKLSDKQRELLTQAIDVSRFDAARGYVEKQRRQRDTLQSLRALASVPGGNEALDNAKLALRSLVNRSFQSPDASYRDYIDALTQEGCKTFADLHNAATPAQRDKAIDTLGGYERDLKALLGTAGKG